MYQIKGNKPMLKLPNFKMAIPLNVGMAMRIQRQSEVLGIPFPKGEHTFIYHRDGEIGQGVELLNFVGADMQEMPITTFLAYKIVPMEMTLKEIEKIIGHEINIIKEIK